MILVSAADGIRSRKTSAALKITAFVLVGCGSSAPQEIFTEWHMIILLCQFVTYILIVKLASFQEKDCTVGK
jgi:hypothetical protein